MHLPDAKHRLKTVRHSSRVPKVSTLRYPLQSRLRSFILTRVFLYEGNISSTFWVNLTTTHISRSVKLAYVCYYVHRYSMYCPRSSLWARSTSITPSQLVELIIFELAQPHRSNRSRPSWPLPRCAVPLSCLISVMLAILRPLEIVDSNGAG